MQTTTDKIEVKPFSLTQIILYHLLPGIPILFFAVLFAHPTFGFGLPIFLSLMLAILFGLIPTEMGILFFTAKRQGKKIRELISFREKMPVLKTVLWALPCILFALAVFIFLAKMEHPIWTIFNWVPEWFRIDRFDAGTVERSLMIVTIVLNLLLNGILGPLVEELYFRGFLLPRMGKLGKAAPLVNTVLFSLYHFFTPWENITRIIAMIPYIYVVWYKKNIRIGIVVHCTMNVLSGISMIVAVMQI